MPGGCTLPEIKRNGEPKGRRNPKQKTPLGVSFVLVDPRGVEPPDKIANCVAALRAIVLRVQSRVQLIFKVAIYHIGYFLLLAPHGMLINHF